MRFYRKPEPLARRLPAIRTATAVVSSVHGGFLVGHRRNAYDNRLNPPTLRTKDVVRTGPFSALEEVHVAAAHGRAEHVPVREPHGGPGEPEHDERDEHQAEFLQQAVGGPDGRYQVGHDVGQAERARSKNTKKTLHAEKILHGKYDVRRLRFVQNEEQKRNRNANYRTDRLFRLD